MLLPSYAGVQLYLLGGGADFRVWSRQAQAHRQHAFVAVVGRLGCLASGVGAFLWPWIMLPWHADQGEG